MTVLHRILHQVFPRGQNISLNFMLCFLRIMKEHLLSREPLNLHHILQQMVQQHILVHIQQRLQVFQVSPLNLESGQDLPEHSHLNLPEILISKVGVPFVLGGTTLLIVVQVTMDFVNQVQSHLIAYQYEGLLKKAALIRKKSR